MNELESIKNRYKKRKAIDANKKYITDSLFTKYLLSERQEKYKNILINSFKEISKIKLLEIGAGGGSNLIFFHTLGIPFKNIIANELLEDRVTELKRNLPEANIFSGDAMQLKFKNEFDVVFQSTVFTSILDDDFKKDLAAKMFEMIKPGGIGLWYDFIYNNPSNPDVKGIPKLEIRKLFPLANKIKFYSVTLAPPIGRRVGILYPVFNLFPILRTHVVAEIHKQ